MLCVEDWAEIRRLHRAEKMPIKVIGRVLGCSKNTVKAARLRLDQMIESVAIVGRLAQEQAISTFATIEDLGLLLVPAFIAGALTARGAKWQLLLLYAAPAFAMLGLHALIANHYTRYNLILIGPLVAVATSLALSVFARRQNDVRV